TRVDLHALSQQTLAKCHGVPGVWVGLQSAPLLDSSSWKPGYCLLQRMAPFHVGENVCVGRSALE
ncbi:hypothetical protein P7K49_012086, partial [Saguinus oedipus]